VDDLLDRDIGALLDLFAGAERGPAAGSVAALVTAAAAALVAKVARMSASVWEDAEAAAAQAESLRARVTPLAQVDAEVYAAAVEQLTPTDGPESEQRDFQLGRALTAAADVPLRIADTAADVAELAALVAARGSPASRPDAVGAAMLAEASARIAAHLVEVNLAVGGEGERARRCREAVSAAEAALQRALAGNS
jgi:methenyltetrahydrofolate cyclohydrolase